MNMKYDPVNRVWYDHTPEEWLARGCSAMSLPCSVAARLMKGKQREDAPEKEPPEMDEPQ